MSSVHAEAQTPEGTIRGVVIDAASGHPLPYATVVVLNTSPVKGCTTDEKGRFCLPPLAAGRHQLRATYMGYEPMEMREVIVSPVKEAVLEIPMKEIVQALNEVTVRPQTHKERPLNPMALTSGRMLSVEEASRYAGGLDDPARLVSSFAGVAGEVSSNSISIRGNSPQSLQWRLEDVEIPNPSHYPEIGGIGGGILTAFSSQVLGNSDFFTGAFPAEYQNALSGVFDMKLRNGNDRAHEHAVQVGTLGVEAASEGPFRKGGKGSYLFNYRYSSMALAGDLVGGALEEVSGMRYQDLSFKINLPTRNIGTFSIWGIGTSDRYTMPRPDEPASSEYLPDESVLRQTMGAAGLGHKIFTGGSSYLKTTVAATYSASHATSEAFDRNGETLGKTMDMRDKNMNLIFHCYLNTKTDSRHTNRTGVTLTRMSYDNNHNIVPNYPYPDGSPMENFAHSDGHTFLASMFTESMFRLSEQWTFKAGICGQYFALNRQWLVEPRAGIRWRAASAHTFALAYGGHSRHEKLDYYFVTTPAGGNRPINKDLTFARAHHLVLSYDWQVSENLHVKVEPYFQYLYDVPVEPGTPFSIINQTDFYMNRPLANAGKGCNYGIDLTLERYLKGGYYYMLTGSLFDSRYKGGDGIWRNTRLNYRFLANALGGKEWQTGRNRQNVWGVNLRLTVMGGGYYTPVDEAASIEAQRPIEDESRTLAERNPAGLIGSFTLSYKINRQKVSHEWAVKMINVTGYKGNYGFDYNFLTRQIDRVETAVTIPNIFYRISF